MSTLAILAVSVCALLAWCALVQAVKEILVARTQPPACPCRDLHSITVGEPTVTTRFGTMGVAEVTAAFHDAASTLRKGH